MSASVYGLWQRLCRCAGGQACMLGGRGRLKSTLVAVLCVSGLFACLLELFLPRPPLFLPLCPAPLHLRQTPLCLPRPSIQSILDTHHHHYHHRLSTDTHHPAPGKSLVNLLQTQGRLNLLTSSSASPLLLFFLLLLLSLPSAVQLRSPFVGNDMRLRAYLTHTPTRATATINRVYVTAARQSHTLSPGSGDCLCPRCCIAVCCFETVSSESEPHLAALSQRSN